LNSSEVFLKLFGGVPVAPGMKQNPGSPIQCKTTPPPFLIAVALALACFTLLPAPNAFGVSPPPDGGYPGANTADGQNALFSLTTGTYNTALGFLSLWTNTDGQFNTGVGAGTLLANTADLNTATGAGALLSNSTGYQNTANGAFALLRNTTGYRNTATGVQALYGNTTGVYNTADGGFALSSDTTGSYNTATGFGALTNNTTGDFNIALGVDAGFNLTTASYVIAIGTSGANVSNSCFIGHIRGVTTANANAIPVLIDSAGQLGTTSSSRRFKNEIKPMDEASEAILGLKPVTFQYKSDNTGTPQFGLIAEEVAKVNPNLVVRDAEGDIYTVRYEAVNAMLLNEFLKEHRKVEEQQATISQLKFTATKQQASIATQEATIADLKEGMGILTAQLKEQSSQIQKVSAQLELNNDARRTIVENLR
jgi:Chaperone of endosialidase